MITLPLLLNVPLLLHVATSSTADVVTNPSAEDTTTIAVENARLNTLLETGMYKSLKGHQTLCDVLKKQILNRNPRKEGVGFERKMNVDGSYWKPEQYPKTTWVAAKEPLVAPSTVGERSNFKKNPTHTQDHGDA